MKLNKRVPIIAIVVVSVILPWAAAANASFFLKRDRDIIIRLTWDSDVDLDLHVTGLDPDGERFHICYRNRLGHGCEYEKDAARGGKAETVMIADWNHGPYQVYVHDYSSREIGGSEVLACSGATVKIFEGAELKHVFAVPQDRYGNLWGVCALYGGVVTLINEMTFEDKPGLVGRDPLSTLLPGDIIMGTPPDTNIPTRWSHVAMYVGDGRVVEAYGTSIPVESFSIEDWKYPGMSYASYYRVTSADDGIRAKAIRFVERQVKMEAPYDIGFHSKQADGGSWYCTELVWAAYMHASDGAINIEQSPDPLGVYPWEIEHSGETALVGGHYEESPNRNWLQMGYVGLKRLFQYVLVPAGGKLIVSFADISDKPAFILFFFLCFSVIYVERKKGPFETIPDAFVSSRYTMAGFRFRKSKYAPCSTEEG
ncbi:MAG: hypothetical protein JXA49_10960 [Actinobacteria bacterium]|nr:hypothetical protein [Actinomycetota bacterium]